VDCWHIKHLWVFPTNKNHRGLRGTTRFFFCICKINENQIQYFVNISFNIKSSFIGYWSNDTVCATPYAFLFLVVRGKLNYGMRIFTTPIPVVFLKLVVCSLLRVLGYWIKYSNQCCVRRKPWTWPVVLLASLSREIKTSLICEKCQLRTKKSVMHMTDRPLTKPHSFFFF
jgi:hypothetical protein